MILVLKLQFLNKSSSFIFAAMKRHDESNQIVQNDRIIVEVPILRVMGIDNATGKIVRKAPHDVAIVSEHQSR